jgi:hypothetical protein
MAVRPLAVPLEAELLVQALTIPPIIHDLLRRGPLRIVHPGLAPPSDVRSTERVVLSDVFLLQTVSFVESSGINLEFGYL